MATDWTQDVKLAGSQQPISLVNPFDREIVVKVERMSVGWQASTAADAMALPQFRKMFSREHFSHHQLTTLTSLSILRTLLYHSADSDQTVRRVDLQEHFQLLNDLSDQLGGTWLKTTDDGAMIAFTRTESAVGFVRRISESLPKDSQVSIAAALCSGPVTASLIAGGIDYYRDPVDRLAQMMPQMNKGQRLADPQFSQDFGKQNLIAKKFHHLDFPSVIQVLIPN